MLITPQYNPTALVAPAMIVPKTRSRRRKGDNPENAFREGAGQDPDSVRASYAQPIQKTGIAVADAAADFNVPRGYDLDETTIGQETTLGGWTDF